MPRGLEFFKNRFSFLNIFKDFNYSKIRLQVDFFKFKYICFTTIPPRNFKRCLQLNGPLKFLQSLFYKLLFSIDYTLISKFVFITIATLF